MESFIFALWFMLPAFMGNISPLFVAKIPLFNTPVDFKKTLGGKRIFGDHKTWRGIVIGIIIGMVTAFLQGRMPIHGAILALGNFAGDLIGAFIKRQYGIPPGGSSLIIDSVPSPLTALLFAYIAGFLTLSIWQSVFIILCIVPLHLLANRLWYTLKLKSVSW